MTEGLLINSRDVPQSSFSLFQRGIFPMSKSLVKELDLLQDHLQLVFLIRRAVHKQLVKLGEKKKPIRKKLRVLERCENSQGRKINKKPCFSEHTTSLFDPLMSLSTSNYMYGLPFIVLHHNDRIFPALALIFLLDLCKLTVAPWITSV